MQQEGLSMQSQINFIQKYEIGKIKSKNLIMEILSYSGSTAEASELL